jgi:hypothetical protein
VSSSIGVALRLSPAATTNRVAGSKLAFAPARVIWGREQAEEASMAQCVVDGDQLLVRLSTEEKVESVHGDVSVPLACVRSVEVVDKVLDLVHGVRVGTGIPGSTAVGTFTSKSARIFGVIHHGQHRGVRISLEGADFDEILIGCADPESMAAGIPVPS